MKTNEWLLLKHGDIIKHKKRGDIEKIYIFEGEQYIEGKNSLFPLSEFDCDDWEKVEKVK